MLEALEYLKQRDMEDCLQLVHFHLGSQITNIRNIKTALTEAARVYAELYRVGAGVKYIDVGGGLGIDYDGSQTDFESSVNYTLQEYANDVVFRIKSVCDEAGVPHPTIISESGRAVVAYHSVLVFDVLGVSNFDRYDVPPEMPPEMRRSRSATCSPSTATCTKKNMLESYHDAVQAMDEALSMFNLGSLTIENCAPWSSASSGRCAARCSGMVRELDYVPEELQRSGSDAVGHLFLQFLDLPVDAGLLGDQAAVPDHADPSPERGADAPGGAGRHHLRLGRQDRPVHRPARRAQHAGTASVHRANRITSAHSCWAPIRRSSATCTTSSATPTRSTFGSTKTARSILDAVIKGDTVREVLAYVQYNADELTAIGCARTWSGPCVRATISVTRIAANAAVLRIGTGRVYVPGGAVIRLASRDPSI